MFYMVASQLVARQTSIWETYEAKTITQSFLESTILGNGSRIFVNLGLHAPLQVFRPDPSGSRIFCFLHRFALLSVTFEMRGTS